MLTAMVMTKNVLRKLWRQREYGKPPYGGWCSIIVAVGCSFIMHESAAKNLDCPVVSVIEMKTINAPPDLVALGGLESGIFVTNDIDATVPKSFSNDNLLEGLQSDHFNASRLPVRAFVYGPEIAAEDELMPATVHCAAQGVVIDQIIRLAVSPNAASFRRVMWRPIYSILLAVKASFRLEFNWIKRSADHAADAVIAARKEINYSH